MKIVIGTETYLSEKFSKVWLDAIDDIQRITDTYDIVGVALFDNNPDLEFESEILTLQCQRYNVDYYRNPPSCNIGIAVEQLAFYMHSKKADAMIHIDIDLLPEQKHIERAVRYLKENKVSGFTNMGGTHFFALTKGSCPEYMTAQRIPKSAAKGSSWWSGNCKGHLFDNMQYWFHYLQTTGWPVHVVNWDVIHAGGASYGQPGSMRTAEVDAIGMKEWQIKSHEDYFNTPKVKKYLCD